MSNHQAGRNILVLFVVLTAAITGCAAPPLLAVSDPSSLSFADDLNGRALQPAIMNSLDYLRSQPPERKIVVADRTATVAHLARTLEAFLALLAMNPTGEELGRAVKQRFDIYQAGRNRSGRTVLVTGYFQPVFDGSLIRTPPYIHPLYAVPDDLVQRSGGRQEKIAGRIVNGVLVPYWTRREIERQGKAAGHELVWLRNPFDAFILHVQGSGLIRLRDGSVRPVRFAAKNGRPYRSIGRYLVDTGRLPLAGADLDGIRAYLAAHPGEREEVLHHNESFIFFSWADHPYPVGNLGRELTAGRSIAVDQSIFPPGALAFLVSRKPSITADNQVRWSPLHRFVLVQDTGSAMRGPGRVDLFWGTGPAAGREAGLMKEKGDLYLLLLREQPAASPAPIFFRPSEGI